ncbi:MAG: hypothetical protein RLZZ479_371 [Bacteroidota bacterium]|jgi:intein/homing endonuclease
MTFLKYKEFLIQESRIANFNVNDKINEGGAYGHLSHPFEDIDLSMQDIKDMISAAVNGSFGPENFTQEKCLSGDTIVSLKSKGLISIKDLVESKIEDDILTSNELGEISYQPIMDWVENEEATEWIEIETEDGQIIRTTPNHRIYVNGFDLRADEIKEGDEVLTVWKKDLRDTENLSKRSKVKSIRKIVSTEKCYDLTVGNNHRYFANGILVHNTDGQQLSISWKDGEIRAARNKSHIKNFGQDSLTIKGIANMFAGRGDIEIAFVAAMKDLNSSVGSLSNAIKEKYFANGRKFASVEIITPVTQNTVPYGQNMLVFHGVIEYDENGNPIGEDKQAGRDLGKLIADANAAAQEMFYVRGPQDISLQPLPNTKSREAYYYSLLNKIMKESGTNLSSSVEEYALGNAKRMLQDLAKRDNIDIPDEYLDALGKRIAGIDKSFTVANIKKNLAVNVSEWFINLEKTREKELKKRVYLPLESIFLELGTEVMKNVSSFLSANPTKAAEEMKKEIDSVIAKIRKEGGEDAIKKMEYELERVAAAGGLESIVPTEGITFLYKGKLYKFTGIFAALHQIRSILVYNK